MSDLLTQPTRTFGPGDPSSEPPGLEAVFEYNTLRINDRLKPDIYRLLELDGFSDADVRDSREENPTRHGETAFDAYYGGRTVTLSGRIECGNLDKLRAMSRDLKGAFGTLLEQEMLMRYWDIDDNFADNTLLDYTFDAGSGTLSISGSALVPSSTAAKRLRHNSRPLFRRDALQTLQFTSGTTIAGSSTCLAGRWLADGSFIYGEVTDTALRIRKRSSGGTLTTLASTAITLVVSTTYWMRFQHIGDNLTAEWWGSAPSAWATPSASVVYELSGSDQTTWGAGVRGNVGLFLTPGSTDWTYNDYSVQCIDPGDIVLPCRKTQPLEMKEAQAGQFFRRDFLVTLRASDPRFLSRYTEYSRFPFFTGGTIVDGAASSGRFYDKTFDKVYTTAMDATGTAGSATNSLTVINRGNFPSHPIIRFYGGMTNPSLTNSANGQSFSISATIADGDYYEVNMANRTVVDSTGTSKYGAVDTSSGWPQLESGTNNLILVVSAHSGTDPHVICASRSAWL